jgi:hypothetical protein
MSTRCRVYYELTTPEVLDPQDEAHGLTPRETIECGYIAQDMSLRDAIHEVGGVCDKHDQWNGFTNLDYYVDERGNTETRSLYLPNHITRASARRVGRLLCVTS